MKTILAVTATALITSASATAVTSALITSKQIKDGTIQLRDLSPAAKAALRGRMGPVGVPGPPGPQGAQGPAGTSWPQDELEYMRRQIGGMCLAIQEMQVRLRLLGSTHPFTYSCPV